MIGQEKSNLHGPFCQPPYRYSMNARCARAINYTGLLRDGTSYGRSELSFEHTMPVQKGRHMVRMRKFPYRESSMARGREIVLVNPQFIHIPASLIPFFTHSNPAMNFQAALLVCYLWGEQNGFPTLFQPFYVSHMNGNDVYQLEPVANSDIDHFQITVNNEQTHHPSHTNFNQPFPPKIHGWLPPISEIQAQGNSQPSSDGTATSGSSGETQALVAVVFTTLVYVFLTFWF